LAISHLEARSFPQSILFSVSILGTNAAQSIAGIQQAEKLEAGSKKPAAKLPTGPRKDDRDLYVTQTESAEAARALSSNEQEDANEDHRTHNPYTPGGKVPDEDRPSLDVEG
jgi:hypothetical protein